MDDSAVRPESSTDVPDDVQTSLQRLSNHQLRETIVHAQRLLQGRQEPTAGLDAEGDEEVIAVTEQPGYFEVVRCEPCDAGCADCPHGPFVYHVTREGEADGAERFHWTLIGHRRSEDPPS